MDIAPPPLQLPVVDLFGADLGVIVRSISITADQSGAFCPPKELLEAPDKVHTKGPPPSPEPIFSP